MPHDWTFVFARLSNTQIVSDGVFAIIAVGNRYSCRGLDRRRRRAIASRNLGQIDLEAA
jgi:hypothetical protein